jgi:hypothetical protein
VNNAATNAIGAAILLSATQPTRLAPTLAEAVTLGELSLARRYNFVHAG